MADSYRTIYMGGVGEIEEKKSRFIAHVFYVENEQMATEKIAEIKKLHYDARHNCYAYILGEDGAKVKSSDDGEPPGTAGKPIMEVLKGEGLTNVLVVVTRYFGGTLLGTGGLIRAYTDATKDGLHNSKTARRLKGVKLKITISYNDEGKLRRFLSDKGYEIADCEYSSEVNITSNIPVTDLNTIKASLVEAMQGKLSLLEGDEEFMEICE